MKKLKFVKALPIALLTPLASFTSLTSCGIFSRATWSWLESTKNNTEINYCLLIGQNDHSDSIERTRYTRMALKTYDKEATEKVKNNANVAAPIEGELAIHENEPGKKHTFKVKELEHMEQKSMAGATWDPITANSSATTWISKHNKKITFFVSNNDSMAEGAYWASNWIKGLPIFGYDANPSTIKLIKSGAITGTVDQNASTQCGAAMMMLRNMIDDKAEHGTTKFGTKDYNPLHMGFCTNDEYKEHPENHKYGYVDYDLITINSDIKVDSIRSVLAASTAINAHPVNEEGKPKTENHVDNYLKSNGEAKEPKDMFDMLTHIDNKSKPTKGGKILMTYNNKAEVYLVSTLKPYFNEYANRLNLDLDVLEGDGTGEGVVINQIKAKEGQEFDGFLINMTYTTSADTYVDELAKIACAKEGKSMGGTDWSVFENRLETPLIFWNRQPQKDGKCDTAIMNNKYFKYCYFIGVDAAKGGEVQGKMITNKITQWYDGEI